MAEHRVFQTVLPIQPPERNSSKRIQPDRATVDDWRMTPYLECGGQMSDAKEEC